jgi:Cu/Zn superoxide dismutase
MRIIGLVLVCFGLILVAAPVAPAAGATTTLTVTMNAQNGSGEDGTATLTQVGSDVQVVLALKNGTATAQPAHIHDGTCTNLKGVVYPLTSATTGASTTVVKSITIDQLLKGPYAINVHKSADDLGTYVSCGNIVASNPM